MQARRCGPRDLLGAQPAEGGVASGAIDGVPHVSGPRADVVQRSRVILPRRKVVVVIGPVGHIAAVEADIDDVEHVTIEAAQVGGEVDELAHVLIPDQSAR